MTQIIVGAISSYPGVPSADWLWQQTPHPLGVWQNMTLQAKAQKPDFLLLYQYDFPQPPLPLTWKQRLRGQKPPSPPDIASLLRGVPKDRIIYLMREPPLEEIVAKNQENYEKAKQYCGYISGPDDLAPNPGYMPAIWYYSGSFRELNEMGVPPKVRRCSWITSGISRTENHRQRLAFLRMLVDSDLELDVYGRGLPSWTQSPGEVKNKSHAIAPYYYNLAIENYADNEWYVSEKLWDALLGWCLPIYYGGPAADKLLPPGSFLRLPSQDEKGLAYIQEVTSSLDAWHDAKDAIAEARQIILHKLNLMAWLEKFVAQF
jgi:hypothetical protein